MLVSTLNSFYDKLEEEHKTRARKKTNRKDIILSSA